MLNPNCDPSGSDPTFELSASTFSGTERTSINDLGGAIDESCLIKGMVARVREFKTHAFVIVRDQSGEVQVVASGMELPPTGSFVAIFGKVVANESARIGYEIVADRIEAISKPARALPLVLDRTPKEALDIQLDYRALSLRNTEVASAFRLQALVGAAFRESLMQQGFVEIHTPKFVDGGTEGGASVFSVSYFDRKISLAQSPQLYKQIAAGALERVFEIGAVYRAENSSTSRHLTEFIGLDFEMGFIEDMNEVMDVEERFMVGAIQALRERGGNDLKIIRHELPSDTKFPRITFQEANDLVERHDTMVGDITFDKAVGDAVLKEYGARFVFITGYPVDEKPFYIMPDTENPGYTKSFDLLFDGLEISSGGQRIHDYEQLRKNMSAHGLDPDQYGGYLQAFEFGMPPHGGGGMGLERITQRLLGLENIREVCMFPRDPKRTTP